MMFRIKLIFQVFVVDLNVAMTVAVETIMDQIFELMLRSCGSCWSVVVAVQAGEGVCLKEQLYYSDFTFFWNSLNIAPQHSC